MQNPRLASRYAKSLVGIAIQTQLLEPVYQDMLLLQSVCKSNHDFVNLLKSPVVKPDKKEKIFSAIFEGKVNELTEKFARLLIQKGREISLPEIAEEVIHQYQQIKNIKKVKVTTAVPLDADQESAIVGKIRSSSPLENVQLETALDESLIGGFLLETNNSLFDATILRDLKDIKSQFNKNVYIPNIR